MDRKRPVSGSADNPCYDVDILFLELVAVHSIGIPRCTQDPDAGSDDPNHRCNRMKGDGELFLENGHQFSDGDRF